MEKKILILGEEYWFARPMYGKYYKDAEYLLDELAKSKNANRYILAKTPYELIQKIKEIEPINISAIFMFHDILSDSFTNDTKIIDMMKYIKNLEKKYNIHIYPGIDVTNNFGSKRYYKTLVDHMKYAALPNSMVYVNKNYEKKNDNEIIEELYKKSLEMFNKGFKKIIIKKGYSYEGKQVKIIKHNITKEEFYEKVQQLDFKKFWGKYADSRDWEEGIDRYYIIQGFNKIIRDIKNEYRVFFLNGKAVYIVFDDEIDNVCVNDMRSRVETLEFINKALAVKIIEFSKKVFDDYKKYFWKRDDEPILFRIDISFATDEIFQDEHSIDVDGFDSKVRIYVNELEIDPTSFFYNRMLCNRKKTVDNESVERTMGKLINDYVSKYNL